MAPGSDKAGNGTSGHGRGAIAGALALALLGATPAAAQPAGQNSWIMDLNNGCGTANPYPRRNESILWDGGCLNGHLEGPGTLIWLQEGEEYERAEGTFRAGELDGEATVTLPDGSRIVGIFVRGVRNGRFVLDRADGERFEAHYEGGRLVSKRRLPTAAAGPIAAAGMARRVPTAPPQPSPAAATTPPNLRYVPPRLHTDLLRVDD
ncbi:MAG: hypothetical protein QF578_25225 [Alphaproteobacteria bacterium]|jgi:hypothetical protein|nr:hypothetical protein [Alphaproteobacteria bacterium]MDP6568148.1 hypothetical protein [Alphaproteobacteria bacterium]MDP6812840.1 hypothetical protein [Alphaproteobacteria bacterium]